MAHILVFGDSIAKGHNDNTYGGWVQLLSNYTEQSFEDLSVYNMGVSGDTSVDILARFENEAKVREAQMVIFSYGTNDVQYYAGEDQIEVTLDKFLKNTQELYEIAKNLGLEVVFMGPIGVDEDLVNPMPWKPEAGYLNNLLGEYNDVLKEFSRENKLLVIDVFQKVGLNLLDDGVHPDQEGHKVLFDLVLKIISTKLDKIFE